MAEKCNLTPRKVAKWLNNYRKNKSQYQNRLNCEQKVILNMFFSNKDYPNNNETEELMEKTGATKKQILTYFRFLRFKSKKDND